MSVPCLVSSQLSQIVRNLDRNIRDPESHTACTCGVEAFSDIIPSGSSPSIVKIPTKGEDHTYQGHCRMLVSQGARTFAASNDVPTCDPTTLVAPRCASEWAHWNKMLSDILPSIPKQEPDAEMPMQDTVGAISWDSNGKLATGVSRFVIVLVCSCAHLIRSGGLLLKYSGRIGEVRKWYDRHGSPVNTPKAAVFGAGCWSQWQSDSRIGVTCSVSGLVYHPGLLRPRIDGL